MKVIKPGFDPVTWRSQVRCSKCNSDLEAEASDLREDSRPRYGQMERIEGQERFLYFTCSQCDQRIEAKLTEGEAAIWRKAYPNFAWREPRGQFD